MRMVKLGDVAKWGSGGTPKRSNPAHFGTDIPWVSIADLNDGLVLDTKEALTHAGLANSSAKLVPAGSLLVAMYGSIGKLGIAGRKLCTSQAIAFAIPDRTRIDTRYLFHFLLANRQRLQSLGRGGTQLNIGQGDLKSMEIDLPALEEQRRIAAILDKADAIRTKRRQVLAHLDLVATAVTEKILEDRSWTSVLSAYAVIQIGPFGSLLHKSDYIEGGIPVINPVHIKNGVLIPDSKFSISEDKASELSLYRLLPGDVVMGRRGEMGRAAVVQEEHRGAVCGTGSLILRPRIKPSEIIHAIVTSPRMRSHLERSSLGATLPNLNASIVNNAPVPDLDEHLAIRFSDTAHSMKAIREKVDSCSAAGEELFASLQSRAFKGEL